MTDPHAVLMSSFDLPNDMRALDGITFECLRPSVYEFRFPSAESVRERLEEGRYFVRVVVKDGKAKIHVAKLP